MATVLRAGALPAPVKVVEERSVDPSLGRDSIESGKRAAIIGGAAVMVFMMAYYLLGGVVANLALILNMTLLPLGLMLVSGIFSLLDNGGVGAGAHQPAHADAAGYRRYCVDHRHGSGRQRPDLRTHARRTRQGKRFGSVISAGYEKAFSAISTRTSRPC